MTSIPAGAGVQPAAAAETRRRRVMTVNLSAYGEPMLWLTGGALAVCVAMIAGLLLLVIRMGMGTFWPSPLVKVTLDDGTVLMGEITRTDRFSPPEGGLAGFAPETRERMQAEMDGGDGSIGRSLFRTGNFDLTNTHFTWVENARVVERSEPTWAMLLERREWGRFYGEPTSFIADGEVVTDSAETAVREFEAVHGEILGRWDQKKALQKHDLGRLARIREVARLDVRQVEIDEDLPIAWATAYRNFDAARVAAEAPDATDADRERFERTQGELERLERFEAMRPADVGDARAKYAAALAEYRAVIADSQQENQEILAQIAELDDQNSRYEMSFRIADGREKVIPVEQIVRAYAANNLSLGDKAGVYLSRWNEFLLDDPRAANAEGGVFPAIIGTVLMTLIMALLVVPFGVMAALYLREYAKPGIVVSLVRIAINNLAGVPSIVFGVFGLGFFCYGVGGFIDGGPAAALPTPTWFLALAVTAVVAFGAFMATLGSVTRPGQPLVGRKRVFRTVAGILWLLSSLAGLGLIATTPFFDGFFEARLPNPTFGKGALIWASFTLALLTLPVVIVATEEALSAVPNSMREGSYACGASKWQTIKRIVLPRAMPGIMTGMILAMARGAGEVAPLMIVGAIKFAPELPISASPSEHFGINRSFMHLGFHIYDLGFQSQNSEAAKPLVFTTTLLLVAIVAFLNLAAIWLRSRLRRRFVGMKF
jgi:ABC-type phosphate transport system permease subunit